MDTQQKAFAKILNCLLSVGVSTGMNDQFNTDVWKAAELLNISKLDLLKVANQITEETP